MDTLLGTTGPIPGGRKDAAVTGAGATGPAGDGRTGCAGFKSSSSFGMNAGRGGPAETGTAFLSAALISGRRDSNSRKRCRS